jgi:hypothetical protein
MLLYNKRKKVEDASRVRFDPLACLTRSLAEYVMQNIQSFSVLLCIDRQEGLNIAFTLPISVGIRQVKQNNRSAPFFLFFPSSKAKP